MAYDGLNWQVMPLPFTSGLNQKADDRARPQPFLDICRDVQFDELGGIQTRYPFGAAAGNIFGGGTIANARRVERNGSETVLFTDTQVYSWNAQLSVWVLRGTHLAVAVDETPRVATPGDQIDGDRAELNGTVMYTWTEGGIVYLAAIDKATGSVLMPPTLIAAGVRPRIVAASTRIHVFFVQGNALLSGIFNPANPAAGTFGTLFASNVTLYDVVRIEGQDGVVGAFSEPVPTSYEVFTVLSNGTFNASAKARTCDGPIALVTTPGTGLQTQIIRANGINIQGDLLTTSTLADVFTGQAIGVVTSAVVIDQITVAYASATTAIVYWTDGVLGETSSFNDFEVRTNTVTTANVVGVAADFRHRLGIASRAFTYAGHVYLWLAFASDSGTTIHGNAAGVRAQLQNSYFLYRDDQTIHARCAHNNGGGFAATTGRLPGVALTAGATSFAWCATSRRRIELGGSSDHSGFGSRSLRDVAFTFDDNRARRCARIGSTLYVAASIPLQYDGVQLAEVGFLYYPWYFDPFAVGAGSGLLAAGTYTWKATMASTNAQGEVDRSTTATGMSLTVPALTVVFLSLLYLHVTMRTAVRAPSIDIWRTPVNPIADSPFYLVTSQDPNAGIVANGYVRNVDTSGTGVVLPDNFPDATLLTKEQNPENGAVLEDLAPPGAQVIVATDTRLFLVRVAGDPHRAWYSKLRAAGRVASFHDTLTFDVPRDGGDITSLWFDQNGVLYVARQTALYAFAGTGKDNLGGGQNYTLVRTVSSDVGAVNHESVALTPEGTIFKSQKGWQLLDASGSVHYIGDKVSDFDAETVLAVHVVEAQHQVRILTAARLIVWDYLVNQWGEWTITDGVHATMANGAYVYLAATGTRTQLATYTGLTYGLDVETAHIKLAGFMGATRVRCLQVLGEYRSAFLLRARIAYDYSSTYTDDKVWPPDPVVVGGPLQVEVSPKRRQCEAIKLRLTAVAEGAAATLVTTALAPTVATNGTAWNAVLLAATLPGAAGNVVTVSIAFEDGAPFTIDVREHYAWSIAEQRWVPTINNVGVRIVCRTGSSPTVAVLENAFDDAGVALLNVTTPDPTPGKIINATAMAGLVATGTLSGGTYVAPTGEALKLTALGLEVGIERGLYRRLAAAQKV